MWVKRNRRGRGREGQPRRRNDGKRRLGITASALVSVFVLSARASAHEGPPYPLFVDKKAGPYLLSVWADPDVGTGTFFIAAEPAQGGALGDDLQVSVCVRPASGRAGEDCYEAERDGVRDRAQYKIGVPFDRQEVWHTRVILRSSRGAGEADADVEATPPGLGRWDILLYFFPFAAVGFLWLRTAIKGRSLRADCQIKRG